MAGTTTVKFYGLLRRQVGKQAIEVVVDRMPLLELLLRAREQAGKDFLGELLDSEKKLLAGTMILVNGKNIRLHEYLETEVHGGDTVDLFSPAGGG